MYPRSMTLDEPRQDDLRGKLRTWRIATGAVSVLALFLGVSLVGQLTLGNPETPTGEPTTSASPHASENSDIVRRDADDPMAIGDVDAPVVLVQWTDLRCPFCAAYEQDTFPTIVDEYVETGLVRIEIRDVAFFGEQSEDAAIAARAAGNQGKFFEFLNVVYAAAPANTHADLPRDVLVDFAEEAGVPDMAQFVTDLDDPNLRAQARESTERAQSLGVTAVPFFVAGDTAVSGAQPIEVFRSFLDDALAKTR